MTSLLERSNAFKEKHQNFDLTRPNEKKDIDGYEDDSIEKNIPFPKNAFEIGKDSDNTTKYTFDNIYQDQNLIQVAQNYYEVRDGIRYDA